VPPSVDVVPGAVLLSAALVAREVRCMCEQHINVWHSFRLQEEGLQPRMLLTPLPMGGEV
jgi:hypothetical protein